MGMQRKLRELTRTERKLAFADPDTVGAGVRRAQIRLGYRQPDGKVTEWLKDQRDRWSERLKAYAAAYPTRRRR